MYGVIKGPRNECHRFSMMSCRIFGREILVLDSLNKGGQSNYNRNAKAIMPTIPVKLAANVPESCTAPPGVAAGVDDAEFSRAAVPLLAELPVVDVSVVVVVEVAIAVAVLPLEADELEAAVEPGVDVVAAAEDGAAV